MDIGVGIVHVGASGSTLPARAVTVLSGGLVDIKGLAENCIPGPMEIKNGAMLRVDHNLTVPAAGGAGSSDLFGTLQFSSGSTLKLGNGVYWTRPITVGTAL